MGYKLLGAATDSVEKLSAKEKSRFQKLTQQAEKYLSQNQDSALLLARQLQQKPAKQAPIHQKALAHYLLGTLTYYQGKYDSAIYHYQQALALQKAFKDPESTARTSAQLSDVLLNHGENEKALKLLLNELKPALPQLASARLHNALGKLYDLTGDRMRGLNYLHKAHTLFNKLRSPEEAVALNNLGNLHLRAGELKKAEKYFQAAEAQYLTTGNRKGLAGIYANQGNILFTEGNQAAGLQKMENALALYEEVKDRTGQVNVLNNLAVYYHTNKQPQKALDLYLQAAQLSEQLQNPQQLYDITGNIYLIYKELRQPEKALAYLEKQTRLHTELYNATRSVQMARLQEEFDSRNRTREIQKLKSQREKQLDAISRRTWERNAAIAGLLATIILAFLLVRSIRRQQRSEAELLAKNEELNQKQVEELLREQELISVHGRLQGQEAERKRIAQDLHDRLGSLLATLKLYFHMSRTEEQRKITTELLDTACQEVRQIAYDMVSGVLMKFGLVAALQDLAQAINQSGQIKMLVNYEGLDRRLDSPIEIELYRIMQELVSNTLKHAQATEISVLLTRYEQSVNLLVEDNGKGFNPHQKTTRWGMGIQGIKNRVENMMGTLTIDSGQGTGTTFLISVPLGVSTLTFVPGSENDTRYKPLV